MPLVRATKVDVLQFAGCEGAAGIGQPAGFGHPVGGAVCGGEVAVGDGPAIYGAGGRDDVLAGVAALPAGASGAGGGGDLTHEGFHVAGGHLVQPQVAERGGHAVPVGAVGAAGARAGRGRDPRYVLGERRHTRRRVGVSGEVGRGEAEVRQDLLGGDDA
ncbi:hypothetical protein ACNAW0_00610 [Micromonospora sp. SL1-18]|uniref:hypothetical protein n=1 Tax=Micromonospora sp. SL1-18 TaxID=3399128 RepID=UPI003A4D2A0B